MYTDFDFEKVYLMLGAACDFKCRHCLQAPFHAHLEKRPGDKLIKYLNHLAAIKPRSSKTGEAKELRIIFFGGEPLLYLDAVQEVVAKVKQPNVSFSMISNGARLTDEVVSLLNELKIHYVVSNDGPLTDRVRDRNVFEDEAFLRRFRAIDSKSVCVTLHAYSQDLYRLWDYIGNKVGDVPIAYEFLTHTWAMPKDIWSYDMVAWADTVTAMQDRLFTAYKTTDRNIRNREAEFFSSLIGSRLQFSAGKAKFPRCGAYRQNINLDLDGNHFLCHNGNCKFSDCSQEGAKVTQEAEIRFMNLRAVHGKACSDCSALPVCHEGCPFSPSSEGQDVQCEFMRILANGVEGFMRQVEEHNTTEVDFE